jgi:hypothetical protein
MSKASLRMPSLGRDYIAKTRAADRRLSQKKLPAVTPAALLNFATVELD